MAEPVEILYGLWTRVGTKNHVLDVYPDRPKQNGNSKGKVHARAPGMSDHILLGSE